MVAMRVNDLIAAWMVGNGVLVLIAPSQRALAIARIAMALKTRLITKACALVRYVPKGPPKGHAPAGTAGTAGSSGGWDRLMVIFRQYEGLVLRQYEGLIRELAEPRRP
jgi:hypothetical protein